MQENISNIKLTPKQQQAKWAVEYFLRSPKKFFLLQGGAGAGKTTVLSSIFNGVNGVATVAPTHKAKNVIKSKLTTAPVYTVDKLLGMKGKRDDEGKLRFVVDEDNIEMFEYETLIIDESSMLGDEKFNYLIHYTQPHQKLIFTGDIYQIPPVNSGRDSIVFSAINPYIMDESYRFGFDSDIMKYSKHIINLINQKKHQIKDIKSFDRTKQYNGLHFITNNRYFGKAVSEIKSDIANGTCQTKLIGYRNAFVDSINSSVRYALFGSKRAEHFLPNDFIVAEDNRFYTTPIFNGDEFIVISKTQSFISSSYFDICKATKCQFSFEMSNIVAKRISDNEIISFRVAPLDTQQKLIYCYSDMSNYIKKNVASSYKSAYYEQIDEIKKTYVPCKYAYCVNAHDSQGSTYNNVYLMESDVLSMTRTRESMQILYTACTRAKNNLFIVE